MNPNNRKEQDAWSALPSEESTVSHKEHLDCLVNSLYIKDKP